MRQDNPQHEILWPVSCKKWGFSRNLTYFLFLLWISFTWNWRKNVYIFLNFLASKVKLADGFMDQTGIKLWNRHIRSGKKWNWRHAASPRHVSFIFSRPNLDGFIILASFIHETTASFTFEPKTQKKYRHFSSVSRETDHKKKKVRFLAKTTPSFIFEPKNPKTKPPVSFGFTRNWAQKKRGFLS